MNILAYMLFQNHVMHATYLNMADGNHVMHATWSCALYFNMADGDDLFFPVVVKKV